MNIKDSFNRLENYLIKEDYKGYDPYDTINSWMPLKLFGKYGALLATQFQKRNPINIRQLIGIKKEYNPKAMGLFLQAYSILYKKTEDEEYLEKAKYFYNWLVNNYSKGYSGICWGYNFPWASSSKYIDSCIPSSVVTGFVLRGIVEYYKITNDISALDVISSAANFIINDLEWTKDNMGICISYTPIKRDICYNASLLGAEVLAINSKFNGDKDSKRMAKSAVDYVIKRQKDNGVWDYSKNPDSGNERMQIDFHQGYILESIFNISTYTNIQNQEWENSLTLGLEYYRQNQFSENGRTFWRVPKQYPIDIHNQAQGIITFSRLCDYHPDASNFANIIANWTINNMQDKKGYFYYQKFRTHTNRISYMRWSQAWMFLALSYLK
ncbi:delta-aminolevulinic acid dehydratase [Candidatus Neomarinimicrobiota bacterium]